jgi:hypothetical protein
MRDEMKIVEGIHKCDCGNEFEWKTFFLPKGTFVAFKWEDVQQNVIYKERVATGCRLTLQCPQCNKRHFIQKEI